jgi:immune inhibitor A
MPLDGAEANAGWTFKGFKVSSGTESKYFNNYYLAEFRQYRDYDEGLRHAYNFGWLNDPELGNWVEHFPYQDGLLISYWDTSFADNNVTLNCYYGRCGGVLLPIDAHPNVLVRSNGVAWRNRYQSYDSTFGLEPTDALDLHVNSVEHHIPSLPANPVFNDKLSYYRPQNPTASVNHPHTGTQIKVQSVNTIGSFMQVLVTPAP